MYRRPQPRDLAESVQIWYESDLVWMVHADLQANPGTWLRWTYHGPEGLRNMPYLEAYAWKNKDGGGEVTTEWADQAFFTLNRMTSSIEPVALDQLPLRPMAQDGNASYRAATEFAPQPSYKTTKSDHTAETVPWSAGSGC